MNILLVCSGNVSRSFLAEVLLKRELRVLGRKDVAVLSAGLYAYPGSPPDPGMVDYLVKAGISYEPHEARGMTLKDVVWSDRIVVMEKDHALALEQSWPEAKEKVELLSRYFSGEGSENDVIDPFGRSIYHYRLAQAQISLAIQNLARMIGQDAKAQHHCG